MTEVVKNFHICFDDYVNTWDRHELKKRKVKFCNLCGIKNIANSYRYLKRHNLSYPKSKKPRFLSNKEYYARNRSKLIEINKNNYYR